MTEPFQFVPGQSGQALRIVFRGFWGMDDLEAYRDALARRASAGPSDIRRVLLDMKHCAVQANEVIAGMETIIKRYAAQIEDYGLLLPDSVLLRLQMKRLMGDTAIQILRDEEAAKTWLERP